MLVNIAVSQVDAGIQVSVDHMMAHWTHIDPVLELKVFVDVPAVRAGLRAWKEQIGKHDFDPFYPGLVFDLSSELRPHLFAHRFGKRMVLHHVLDFQLFHDDRFGKRVDDVSGDFVDIVAPQIFQLLVDTGDFPLLLPVVSAFP